MDEQGRPTRMVELPDHTQEFLISLREEEIVELQEAIQFMRSVKTVGTFGKWLIITAVGAFIGAVSLGESILKLKGWFK
jgi:hypothetical protein